VPAVAGAVPLLLNLLPALTVLSLVAGYFLGLAPVVDTDTRSAKLMTTRTRGKSMYRSLAVMLRKYLIRIVPGLQSLASSRLRWPLEVISSSDFTTNTSTTLSKWWRRSCWGSDRLWWNRASRLGSRGTEARAARTDP
jgi:hypothetical protein